MTVLARKTTAERSSATEQYYLDKAPGRDGTYRVHRKGCRLCGASSMYLGCHASPSEALRRARRYYVCLKGCERCCRQGTQ